MQKEFRSILPMSALFLLGIVLLCVSCRREGTQSSSSTGIQISSSATQDPVIECQNRVTALEESVQALQQQINEKELQRQSIETSYKQNMEEKDAVLADLKKQSDEIVKALYMYQCADMIKPPRTKKADVFPVRVHNINYVFADGTEEGLGKVRFGIRNLTKTDKCVFLSTGEERKRITLASGVDETIEMGIKKGNSIKVDVNHLSRSFNVSTDAAVPANASIAAVRTTAIESSHP